MQQQPNWHYDEFKQVGKDYGMAEEVERYDASHADFRDVAAENDQILAALDIHGGDAVLDFGSGTGAFAIQTAPRCKKVYAVDVSPAMLDFAKKRAQQAGLANIEFHYAGFLSYHHQAEAVDAVVSSFALHHLPDIWKGVALQNISRLLKPGGRFYLRDVVLAEQNVLDTIAGFIRRQEEIGGEFLCDDAEQHFREEYSTYDWIMEGLLTRAGFTITRKELQDGLLATYLCLKPIG